MNREEKKPIISMGDVNDATVGLEAYLIASALTSWTRKMEGIGRKVIDYIKIDFYEGPGGDVRIYFKLTLKTFLSGPTYVLDIISWHKLSGYLGMFPDCCLKKNYASKEDVIAGIKKIVCLSLLRLAEKDLNSWEHLKETAEKLETNS